MNSVRPILYVDDSPLDTELALEALQNFRLANRIVALRDGAEALDYLFQRGVYAGRPFDYPAVVLLDLKMPRVDGLEVLRSIKSDLRLRVIPVVVMTSSREEQDMLRSYELGVNAYVVKPIKFQAFSEAVSNLGAFWAVLNELPHVGAVDVKGCGHGITVSTEDGP